MIFSVFQRRNRKGKQEKPHNCFLGGSLRTLWEWSWASLRERPSFDGLPEMQQGLKRDGWGLGGSFPTPSLVTYPVTSSPHPWPLSCYLLSSSRHVISETQHFHLLMSGSGTVCHTFIECLPTRLLTTLFEITIPCLFWAYPIPLLTLLLEVFFCFVLFCSFFFWDKGLQTDLFASASQALGIQVCLCYFWLKISLK